MGPISKRGGAMEYCQEILSLSFAPFERRGRFADDDDASDGRTTMSLIYSAVRVQHAHQQISYGG